MNAARALVLVCVGAMIVLAGRFAVGQVVINELVKEERTAGSGSVTPDTREFVELYNAGSTPIDISNWKIVRWDYALDGPGLLDITIPAGSTIQPNGYFVIGGTNVAGANYVPDSGQDLFPDVSAYALELRNSGGTMQDAVAYDVWQSGIFPPTTDQAAQIGQGYHGQLLSMNANAPNARISWSRWEDGRDTNNNGRDFGLLPLTPGASNETLPQNQSHTVPDVDGLAVGSTLPGQYYASFVLPRVIDPTVATPGLNPRALPEASPQGGKAIVAWDNTGGGNTSYSKELVNSFDLYAYFDTSPLGVAAATGFEEWESTMYGIGSADPFFGNPDPSAGIYVPGTILQNAATGLGWLYQQYEFPDDPATTGVDEYSQFTKLMLVDMGDGGNSYGEAGEWEILTTIDMSQLQSDWYRLGIDYDPATGNVIARFDDQEFMFTTETGLLGNFFVGYREAITGEQSRFATLNPPIYDMFVAAPEGLTGDYNDDGKVDAADYVVWRKNQGTSNTLPNDPEGGTIGQAQYENWVAAFGDMASGSGGAAAPEPGSLLLVMAGLLAMTALRRR